MGIHTETGVIASGDQFVCDADRKAWIRDFFKAEAVEMEGAAIGQVCFVNEIPFVVAKSTRFSMDFAPIPRAGTFTTLKNAESSEGFSAKRM